MKKILIYLSCIMIVVLLSGCSMDNTPTKKVENFLDNYTSGSNTVLNQLKEMVDSDSMMDDNQRNTYSDIMKRQYKDMTYEIKDETINGDNATVTAEIEVYDYYKANKDAETYYNNNPGEFNDNNDNEGLVDKAKDAVKDAVNGAKDAVENGNNNDNNTNGNSSDSKYLEYRLNQLTNTKDRVKYTVDFTLTKVDGKWKLNDIDDATRQKIHGLYEH